MNSYLTPTQAEAEGLRCLAGPYKLPEEEHELDAVCVDLERGSIDYALVGDYRNAYIYRTVKGWKEGDPDCVTLPGANDWV